MKNQKKMLLLILLLIIGFAAVSTTLVINGVIGISNKKEDFKVIFTNAKLDGVEKKEFIDSTTKQTINYETNKLTTLEETTVLEYDVTNTSRLYDASVSITCNIVDDAGNIATSEYISMVYTPNNMTVPAGETKRGSITTKLTKASTEDKSIKVKCTLNANATERTSLGKEYKEVGTYELVADANNNGVADIGDEIAIGEDHFYVISKENGKLNALAKYNLMVGNEVDGSSWEVTPLTNPTGIQDPSAKGFVDGAAKFIGTVAFSNSNGWPYENNDTINIKEYEGPVKEALYGTNGYEKYIQNTIPTATVRLIYKGEIEALVNDGNELSSGLINSKADAKEYQWLYSTSYWTQSANSGRDNSVLFVCSNGVFSGGNFSSDSLYGVRPVITISEV